MKTAASDLVTVLYDEGIRHLFVSPGMLTKPLRDAFAEAETSGDASPHPVLCVHERVAVCAAHGHHLVTGQPEAVMVHVEGGPLELGAALQNAARSRVPLAVLAGAGADVEADKLDAPRASRRRTISEAPPAVGKWAADLGRGGDLSLLVRRAFQVARAEPWGLAELTIPRRSLAEPTTSRKPSRRLPPPRPPAPDQSALEEMAELLATAERPVIAVGRVGRHQSSVHNVAVLAETLGAPVIDFRNHVNLPPNHPLNAGLNGSDLVAHADAILMLDLETPCLPGLGPIPPQAWLLQIDTDCLKTDLRNWNCPVEIAITADTRQALPTLQALLADRLVSQRRHIQDRKARVEETLRLARRSWMERSTAGDPAAAADALLAELNRALPNDAVLFEEAADPGVLRRLERPPGHFFRCTSGGSGWALGAALGAQLARPQQPVVALCQDRAFADGLPSATFWTAHRDSAPFLTVVLDRDPAQKPRSTTRSRLPSDVVGLARASGAETAVVTHPSEVPGCVERLLAVTRDGVCAVLALKLPPP